MVIIGYRWLSLVFVGYCWVLLIIIDCLLGGLSVEIGEKIIISYISFLNKEILVTFARQSLPNPFVSGGKARHDLVDYTLHSTVYILLYTLYCKH